MKIFVRKLFGFSRRIVLFAATAAICVLPVAAVAGEAEADCHDRTNEKSTASRAVELARTLAGTGVERATIETLVSAYEASGMAPEIRASIGSRELRVRRVADELGYIGNDFVGAWVLNTPQGLILIDALSSEADVDAFLLPGLAKLGLEPADIRYLLVTHGHFDHAGGALAVKNRYGAKLVMSEEDWSGWNRHQANEEKPILPEADVFVSDKGLIDLGGVQVEMVRTPGHTLGTISAFLTVHDQGRPVILALWGGNAMPRTLEESGLSGGLYAYRDSLIRFIAAGEERGVAGVISSHPAGDGASQKDAMTNQEEPNPWLIGTDRVVRLLGGYVAMTDAAIAKHEAEAGKR